MLQQIGNPFAVLLICFSSRHLLDVMRVYQKQMELLLRFQNVSHWFPIDPGRLIDGIEQIVFEQGGLLGQRGVEEPVLVRGGGDHKRTRLSLNSYGMRDLIPQSEWPRIRRKDP